MQVRNFRSAAPRRLLLIIGLSCLARPGYPQTARTFIHTGDVNVRSFAGSVSPQWHSRLLLALEPWGGNELLMTAIDREGLSERIAFSLPEASWIQAISIGSGPDRSLVLGGIARSADSRGTGFIAWISPDRERRTVIRTGKFFAFAVTVAADGAIWAAGQEARDADFKSFADNIFRRFAASGERLGGFDVSEAGARSPRHGNATENSRLMPSRDHVGWFTNGNEYFEFSLAGALTARFDGPLGLDYYKTFRGVALSDSSDLVVGVQQGDDTQHLILDRATRRWVQMTVQGETVSGWNEVLGFDGNFLVTRSAPGKLRLLRSSGSEPVR
jgi:hypothetical protein